VTFLDQILADSIHKLQPITINDNAQRKSKRLEKAKDQATNHNAIAKEEELVQEKLKTNDECIAEAMLQNLQEWTRQRRQSTRKTTRGRMGR
jgi:hypothetical protein